LEESINEIRESIENLEKRRSDAVQKLSESKHVFEVTSRDVEKLIRKSEERAKKISEQSTELISNAIRRKQREYDNEMDRIRGGLYSELHHKIADMIVKEIERKIIAMRLDRNLQNEVINKAINDLGELIGEGRLEL
jgi:F0F1-type ATP synthase membrane subunit b/b'